MTEARWRSLTNLRSTEEQIWPENLTDILLEPAFRQPIIRACGQFVAAVLAMSAGLVSPYCNARR